jgi:hypothetical protein
MSRATAPIRDFSARLIAHEAKGKAPPRPLAPAIVRICEKLRPQVARLMGNGGFRALLTRALALAKAEVSTLRAVRVNADGTLEALNELGVPVGHELLAKGGDVLLAHLLGLLVALIGANLTLGLVREGWPDIRLDKLELGNGDKNEETK